MRLVSQALVPERLRMAACGRVTPTRQENAEANPGAPESSAEVPAAKAPRVAASGCGLPSRPSVKRGHRGGP